MIGAEDLRVNLCACQPVAKVLADYKIVDTPTNILLSGLETV